MQREGSPPTRVCASVSCVLVLDSKRKAAPPERRCRRRVLFRPALFSVQDFGWRGRQACAKDAELRRGPGTPSPPGCPSTEEPTGAVAFRDATHFHAPRRDEEELPPPPRSRPSQGPPEKEPWGRGPGAPTPLTLHCSTLFPASSTSSLRESILDGRPWKLTADVLWAWFHLPGTERTQRGEALHTLNTLLAALPAAERGQRQNRDHTSPSGKAS